MTEYRMCTNCILDTTAKYITFDQNGVCNYCAEFNLAMKQRLFQDPGFRKQELSRIVEEIKENGKGKKYDCLTGISGGVDSTYIAYLCKQMGLRPLIVHFDNGWNSELAVKNIENVLAKLGFDLSTYVINWEEFKDLQIAYLRASVVDAEVPTDQLIFATLYKIAYDNGLKYILNGYNIVTESVMPKGWNFSRKTDLVNLTNIHKIYGKRKLVKFPKLGFYQRYFYEQVVGIRSVYILDYLDYNKQKVKETLVNELEWKDYGGKHYESIFTRFYQGYILPKKFNIDKRTAHLSNLICAGQLTRDEALRMMETPDYTEQQQLEDKKYVLKKLGLSELEFEDIMNKPPVDHESFGIELHNTRKHWAFQKALSPIIKLNKVFRTKAAAKRNPKC